METLRAEFRDPAKIEIINRDNVRKTVTLLVTTKRGERGILLFAPAPFIDGEEAETFEDFGRADAVLVQQNDKYAKCRLTMPRPVLVDSIFPANDVDVEKRSKTDMAFVRETAEMYARCTKPFIDSVPRKQTEWVRNLVDPERRAGVKEEFLFEDDDFVLLLDSKWDGRDARNMYCLAIVKSRHGERLRSVRDLRGPEDEQLLRHVRQESERVIAARYGLRPHQYRVCVHYLPSFYHFHVHFISLESEHNAATINAGRALILDDVIDALHNDPLHFARCALSLHIPLNSSLFKSFQI